LTRPSLEAYALDLAKAAATRSEDPHRQVGACVLGARGEVLATGYNGPPAGIDFSPEEWADRDFVRAHALHAEANALRYVLPGQGAILATTLAPCAECLKAARAQGIRMVVFRDFASTYWTPQATQAIAWRFGMELRMIG